MPIDSIPGITDTDANIHGIAELYKTHQVTKAVLQFNNPVWLDKLVHFGRVPTADIKGQFGSFYDTDESLRLKEVFRKHGIEVRIE